MTRVLLARYRHAWVATVLLLVAARLVSAQSPHALEVISGVGLDGAATEQWLRMLRARLTPAEHDSVRAIHRVLRDGESAWGALVRTRQAAWVKEIPALAMPFAPVAPPSRALVVLGNRGGSDAFVDGATTIGFDLEQLQANYGSASDPRSADLIDRLFRHEYTHLMQKAWRARHPWQAGSPLQEALLDMWLEGQGNYYSLSERWRTQGGQRAELSRRALSTLEPRLVARLAALACAPPEKQSVLTRGLSSGRFDQKWGALPIALWLEDEHPDSREALRKLVLDGPMGVWDLAARRLPEPLRVALEEVRVMESACTVR